MLHESNKPSECILTTSSKGVAPAESEARQFIIFGADEHQHRGIGTELVKQTIAYETDYDHKELHLSVEHNNNQVISVYRNTDLEVTVKSPRELSKQLSLDTPIQPKSANLPLSENPTAYIQKRTFFTGHHHGPLWRRRSTS